MSDQYNTEPNNMQTILDRLADETEHLKVERDLLSAKLSEIQSQLESAGIDSSSAGLVQLIQQLTEQRVKLQEQNTALRAEYNRLLEERVRLADRIQEEDLREARIRSLENELENLAVDRDAAIKQRNKMQHEFDELQNKLDLIKEHRTRLIAQASGYEEELKESHLIQAKLHSELRALADSNSDFLGERDRLLAEKRALETERNQLLARIDGDRDRLQEMGTSGVGSLTQMVEELTVQRNQLERQLNELRTSLASTENDLDALQVQIQGAAVNNRSQYYIESPELLLALVHELRTPMTSITGYVDLLLGESAGILGEMQRKFLQRVSANISRLTAMLNDLIRITEIDSGSIAFEAVPVNITNVIEDAITKASNQFREKDLAINLDIDPRLPIVYADRDAVEQILGQLLSNAYLASPPNTEISVQAHRQDVSLVNNHPPSDCLYVTVEDRGGGIRPDDELRVFARKYRAEHPLIPGLGDTGVGLAIAKALVESQGGRLWVETKDNIGSVFIFALPIQQSKQHGRT